MYRLAVLGVLTSLAVAPSAEAGGLADKLAAITSTYQAPDIRALTTFPLPTSQDSWKTSGFGWRDDPKSHRRKFHSGADVRAKPGTPVFAAGSGTVIFAGRQGGYGNIVIVDHGNDVLTRYAHLRRIHTKKGEAVTGGQKIGQVGSTGRTTGPHLHFEVRLAGSPVDPTTALTVAELQRDTPLAGHLASFALSPETQSREVSELDPPRVRKARPALVKGESRPERAGHKRVVRPTS